MRRDLAQHEKLKQKAGTTFDLQLKVCVARTFRRFHNNPDFLSTRKFSPRNFSKLPSVWRAARAMMMKAMTVDFHPMVMLGAEGDFSWKSCA